MKRALRTSRWAGLALALALGVAAFGATVAHAEVGAEWRVKGAAVTDELKAQIDVTELESYIVENPVTKELENLGKIGILLTKTGLTTVEVTCTAMKFVDALLKVLGVVLGKIHFDNCTTKLNKGATSAICIPHSPEATKDGLIETNLLKGLIKLHEPKALEKVDQLELTPDEGAIFATLIFGKIALSECSIKKFDITGKAFLEASANGEGLTEQTSHLFLEAKTLSKLLFGGNPATIDGSAKAALIGMTHAGMNWSGHTK